MSALCHQLTSKRIQPMSAFAPKADTRQRDQYARFCADSDWLETLTYCRVRA
jgi:hypothetical protein